MLAEALGPLDCEWRGGKRKGMLSTVARAWRVFQALAIDRRSSRLTWSLVPRARWGARTTWVTPACHAGVGPPDPG